MASYPTCRACGCSRYSACWGEETEACWWVQPDLCSACSGDQPDATRDEPVDLIGCGYPGDAAGPALRQWSPWGGQKLKQGEN